MEKEFNLSEKRILNNGPYGDLKLENLYPEKDIKEFIKIILEAIDSGFIPGHGEWVLKIIKKRAGDKLITKL